MKVLAITDCFLSNDSFFHQLNQNVVPHLFLDLLKFTQPRIQIFAFESQIRFDDYIPTFNF